VTSHIPNSAAVEALVSKLAVMKPSTVKENNTKQLIKLDALLDSSEYVAEDKIDGCHYLMVACRFFSSDHVEKTDNFPHLRDFFIKLGMPNLILDGEIHYPGKTSQFATRVTGADPSTAIEFQRQHGLIHYTVWDMLRTPKGTWLINEPLHKRRKLLEYFYEHYVKGTEIEPYLYLTKWVVDNKRRFKDEELAAGREGIVLKRLDSLYVMGKRPAWIWIKIKQKDTADLFITGFEPPKVEYTGDNYETWPYWKEVNGVVVPVTKYYYMGWIGALELSAYVNDKVTKICTCAGINEELRKDISENPEKYLNKVVKISYMEKTEAGFPRHPRFEGFHESKTPEECIWSFDD